MTAFHTTFPQIDDLAASYGVDADVIELAVTFYSRRHIKDFFAKAFDMDVIMAKTALAASSLTSAEITHQDYIARACSTDGNLRVSA